MPQLQSIVLTDRAATPVNHTFTPRGKEDLNGGRCVKAGVTSIGDLQFTIEPRETPGGRKKRKLTLSIPVVQTRTENGVVSYVVTRTARAMCEFDFASDTTEQERKDIIGMMQSALDPSKVLTNDVLVKLENVW